MKWVLLLLLLCISSYRVVERSFVEELNYSVIDGFYGCDTIGKSREIYLLRENN